jgi:hypothetical protein
MNRSSTTSKDAVIQKRKGLLFKSGKKSSNNQHTSSDGQVDVISEWPGSEKPGGIPDWENPIEKVLCSPSIPNETEVVSLEEIHATRTQRPRLNRTVLRSQNMHEFRKPAVVRKPIMVKANQHHHCGFHEEHEETMPKHENMVVECAINEESSLGDESIDESILNDTVLHFSRPTYGRKESIETTSRHFPRRNAHNFGSDGNSFVEDPQSIYEGKPYNACSVSEDEQHLIDLAMERSIQDFSAVSVQPVSVSNESYHKSNHVTMGSNYLRRGCSENQLPQSSLNGKFIWKREGKTWQKVSADSYSNNSHQRHQNSENLALHSVYDDYDHHLDEMEQKLIEEAMHRSRNDFKTLDSPTAILDIDPDEAQSRIQEFEQEKALLEIAMKRSLDRRSLKKSFAGSVVSDLPRSSFPDVENLEKKPSLSDAGCHLAMIGQSMRRPDNHSPDGAPTRGVHRHNSCDSAGSKLVWKRGPNNRWGRFPESEPADERANISEEMPMAEAMKRSLEDM